MPEFRQEVQDVERRAAVATALDNAFDKLDAELTKRLPEESQAKAIARILAVMKREMASKRDEPFLAYGKPYAEWRKEAGFMLTSSVAKPFKTLADAMNAADFPWFSTPLDSDSGARVRFRIQRPLGKGYPAGIAATFEFSDETPLSGGFPDDEGQRPFLAPRGHNPARQQALNAVATVLQEAPGFLTLALTLLHDWPKRHHVLVKPCDSKDSGIAVDIYRPKASVLAVLGTAAAIASMPIVPVLGAFAFMGDDRPLTSELRASEGLYTASLQWDTHGKAPKDFLVIRRGADGEFAEVPSAMPAQITGLQPGTRYVFRVRRRLFRLLPWAFVTRELAADVPQPYGPVLLFPAPQFGCTEVRFSPPEPRVGQRVTFRAGLYGTTAANVHLDWAIGDVPLGLEGSPAFHTFTKAATYVVGLTLTSPDGVRSTCGQLNLVVRAADTLPTTPAPPTIVTELALNGTVQAMEPLGGTLLFVVHHDALSVVDIGGGTAVPRLIAELPLPGARDLALVKHLAYVALGTAGLAQIDLTEPNRPTVLSTLPGDFRQVATLGSTLVANGDAPELRVYEVTSPGHIEARRVVRTLAGLISRLVFLDDSAVLCARAKDSSSFGAGLVRVAIRDGTISELVTTASIPDVAIANDVAFAPSAGYGVSLVSLGAADPLSTRKYDALDEAHLPGVLSVSRVKDRLYVGRNDGVLSVVDIAAPARPAVIGTLPVSARATRVIGVDGRLVIGAEGKVIVVRNP